MELRHDPITQRPNVVQASMNRGQELPDDPALPGLVAIRALGLSRALPALNLQDTQVELANCGYTPGSRITLDVHAGERHFAVKAYAEDPANEASLYQSLADAGRAAASGCRAPPLLLWDRELRVLAIGWLDGPSAEQLILSGQGARAGELAARWLRGIAELPVKTGSPYIPTPILSARQPGLAAMAAADATLGAAATVLAEKLDRKRPKTTTCHLVHGTFYTRHIFDLGTGPGVIDWQRFSQGPMELDAGIFLATVWRAKLRPTHPDAEATRAEESFLAGLTGLLDEDALAWHRSAMLLRLATKLPQRKKEGDWQERSHALLAEASRFAISGSGSRSGPRTTHRRSG